ncbi:hypothetical protein JCM33374_g2373 [Metschnikowia sp. JCM 33374]|nr:hypothetical protein JCM33374_g2373 [Metschnikowia sp. JCM 33374]
MQFKVISDDPEISQLGGCPAWVAPGSNAGTTLSIQHGPETKRGSLQIGSAFAKTAASISGKTARKPRPPPVPP